MVGGGVGLRLFRALKGASRAHPLSMQGRERKRILLVSKIIECVKNNLNF